MPTTNTVHSSYLATRQALVLLACACLSFQMGLRWNNSTARRPIAPRANRTPFYESLVHPAMLSHGGPKKVLVMVGDEEYHDTVKEVIKHKSVQSIVVVTPSKESSSESTSSSVRVSRKSLSWLRDSGNGANFDVIIWKQFNQVKSDSLYHALSAVLSDKDGILIVACGRSLERGDVDNITPLYSQRVATINAVSSQMEFEHVRDFELGRQSFLVAFRSFRSKSVWMQSEAMHALALKRQIQGELQFFDSATMVSFQQQPRLSEDAFCRQQRDCVQSHGFDPEVESVPASSLQVKQSLIGENAGRGIFASQNITQNSYIALDRFVHYFYASPATYDVVFAMVETRRDIFEDSASDMLECYLHDYGEVYEYDGAHSVLGDSNILVFSNHGCNGTYNIGGLASNITEYAADPEHFPEELQGHSAGVYNPFFERNMPYTQSIRPTRDIQEGEEILANYLSYASSIEYWEYDIGSLRSQCAGTQAGPIEEYQQYKISVSMKT